MKTIGHIIKMKRMGLTVIRHPNPSIPHALQKSLFPKSAFAAAAAAAAACNQASRRGSKITMRGESIIGDY